MAATILDTIIENKRRELAGTMSARPLDQVRRDALTAAPSRDFHRAVFGPAAADDIRLIAEIKKASPSAGMIREDFDPVAIGRAYETAGASALSILTDRAYFRGDVAFIEAVKRSVSIPVLQKDFIVDPYQIFESRAAGADAVLLIASVLSPPEIDALSAISHQLGMSTLIEVHNEAELRAVLPFIGAARRNLLGINNRDLKIQKTDLDTTRRLAALVPPGTPFVAESGIASREDVLTVQQHGAAAMLVGEVLMRARDIAHETRVLLGRPA
ncbi:MAG: indole-3-glycerol phosphate synthase TrpC [Phycisphaerae bacterium]|nr:indole-3-glycerol phosphate synthase TrpC [Phycisphaerae bacterium]